MKKLSDTEKTLRVLKRVGPYGVHSFHLAQEIGSYRVAARINDLKRKGYVITSEPQTVGEATGCRYYLRSEPAKKVVQPPKKPVTYIIDKERNVVIPVYA